MRRYGPSSVPLPRKVKSCLFSSWSVMLVVCVVCFFAFLLVSPFSTAAPADRSEQVPATLTHEETFQLADANRDGKINFEEFVLGDPTAREDFDFTDKNGDKKLTKEEFVKYYIFLEELQKEDEEKDGVAVKLLPKDVMFKNGDKNKDSTLDFEEFAKMDAEIVIDMRNDFANYDEDDDNFLTIKEFKGFMEGLDADDEADD